MSAVTTPAAPARPRALARGHSAIIPGTQPAIRTLVIAMTVMCYLASLAIGGLMLISRAVDSWTGDIAREVTVQVRPVEGREMEAELARAAELIRGFDGITEVRVFGRQAAADLLEPWLGEGRLLDELPVPRLIAVALDRASPPDLDRLKATVEAEVAGASLDTHRHWQSELTRLASAMQWLGLVILVVVVTSAITLVVQVTHTALEANRDAIEVLHLVGAKDGFIATAVERRFLAAGLLGGILGAAAGLATFAAASFAGYTAAPAGLAEASRSLIFGPSAQSLIPYLVFALVPVVATLTCLFTARLAVLRLLRRGF